MRRRRAAITMNVLDRVMALFMDDGNIPRSADCDDDIVRTHFDAMERFSEAAIRYGKVIVPKPSWVGNQDRYEAFNQILAEFGLGDVLVPESLARSDEFHRIAIESLVRAGEQNLLQAVLNREEGRGNWSEFVLRENQVFSCPFTKDVREEWGNRYVDDETFELVRPFIPSPLVDHSQRHLGYGPAARRRTELYIVSSLVRAYESDIIYRSADGVDYFVFILHSPLGEIPLVGSASEPLTRSSTPIVKLLSSFFHSILFHTTPRKSAPAKILTELGELVNHTNVKKLRQLLDQADRDPSVLMELEDFIDFHSPEITGEGEGLSELSKNVAALGTGEPFLQAAAALSSCRVFINRREKHLNRTIGPFVRRRNALNTAGFDSDAAKKKFKALFCHKFGG